MRRIRYLFNYNDSKMIELFGLAGSGVTRVQISAWLKKEDDPSGQVCSDTELAIFLNGMIVDKRGRRDGAQPVPEKILNNNIVFVKLKIALNLKADDILEILDLVGFRLSKHELSAFFRKPGHKHFRACKDQVLRNFMNGLNKKYRDDEDLQSGSVWKQTGLVWPDA